MKKKRRAAAGRILAAAVFLLVFALLFTLLSDVLRGRGVSDFYRQKRNSLDVLFLGSSHMLNAVSPMELWREYGIASYNLAENGQLLPVTYYVLMDALDRQDPELVVVDIYKIVQDTLFDTKSYLHTSIDGMPLGRGKLRTVYGLLPAGERTEFLFDIVLYHDRWKELGDLENTDRDPDLRGYVPLYTVEDRRGFELLPAGATADPPETAVDYLRRIVEHCRERDVELLFVAAPFTTPVPDDMDRQQRVNAAAELAQAWGVPFLNLMYRLDDMGFDMGADMADMYHANVSGMRKITGYLGGYIAENYRIPDRRDDSRYASWDEACERYLKALENP